MDVFKKVMGLSYIFKSLFRGQSKEWIGMGRGDLAEVIGRPLIQYQNGLFFGIYMDDIYIYIYIYT